MWGFVKKDKQNWGARFVIAQCFLYKLLNKKEAENSKNYKIC